MNHLPKAAWEPLTPRGVAAFAHATAGRLWLVQFIVAAIVAAAIVWFLYDNWCPTIREGIEQLPDTGEIHYGSLDWQRASPTMLAEGTFLAISVNLDHRNELRSPAHMQVEFGKETFRIFSLAGYFEGRYPAKWIVAFNRKELKPWWGAWQPALLAGVAVITVTVLLLVWFALATAYAVPAWLIAFFANRDLRLQEACQLAGAALMPGALLMALGIVLYGFGFLDNTALVFVAVGHLVVGWIYLFVSLPFLPKHPSAAAGKNPFAGKKAK